MKKEGTKKCKYCKSEIAADAKICPNCRKKQKGHKLLIIIAVIVVLAIIGAIAGGGDDNTSQSGNNAKVETKENGETQEIKYTPVTADKLVKDLEENAINASDTYKDQHIEITGKLGNIDSSGDYIDIDSSDDFDFTSIQCYLQNDEQRAAIKKMKKGDKIVVKGKCFDVGEVLGYSIDIDSIKKAK